MRATRRALAAALVVASGLGLSDPGLAGPLDDKLAACAACHGEGGNSSTPGIPSLAGQPQFFLVNQLILIREGVRPVSQMAPIVGDLKDADIEAIAAHYSALPPKASEEPVDTAKAARGKDIAAKKHCASCHLPSFAGQDQMPRLAKQRIDYMFTTLKAYRDSTRPSADGLMAEAVVGIPDDDLAALAHYVASH